MAMESCGICPLCTYTVAECICMKCFCGEKIPRTTMSKHIYETHPEAASEYRKQWVNMVKYQCQKRIDYAQQDQLQEKFPFITIRLQAEISLSPPKVKHEHWSQKLLYHWWNRKELPLNRSFHKFTVDQNGILVHFGNEYDNEIEYHLVSDSSFYSPI